MKVELLYFVGCPNQEDAEQMVREVAAEIGHPVSIDRVLIEDETAATALQFAGSPTIRVDGMDGRTRVAAAGRRPVRLPCLQH